MCLTVPSDRRTLYSATVSTLSRATPQISSLPNRDPRGGFAAENCLEKAGSPVDPIRKSGTFHRNSTAPFRCGDPKPNCPYASASALEPDTPRSAPSCRFVLTLWPRAPRGLDEALARPVVGRR